MSQSRLITVTVKELMDRTSEDGYLLFATRFMDQDAPGAFYGLVDISYVVAGVDTTKQTISLLVTGRMIHRKNKS